MPREPQKKNKKPAKKKKPLSQKFKDKLALKAKRQLKTSIDFKQPRMDAIKRFEDMYNNRTRPALKGRSNIPLALMGGYVDTLMSKIDDPPTARFTETEEADYKKAQKVQAHWEIDKGPTKSKIEMRDRFGKKLAIFSGRAFYLAYSQSIPDYQFNLINIDHNDFVGEPMGGADLEDHLFHGHYNIFKVKSALIKGAKAGIYNKENVKAIIDGNTDVDTKINFETFLNKQNRFKALGLDPETHNFVGQALFNFCQWIMDWDGELYYVLFETKTGKWIRLERLEDMFGIKKTPYASWATHEDPFNLWSKSPCDDWYPTCYAAHKMFNQMIEAREKTIWNQRGYDPDMVKDPAQLYFSPDGLVTIESKPNKSLSEAIYEFKGPQIGDTLGLLTWLLGQTGKDTGVNSAAQGSSEQAKKVGVLYADLQQVADRLGLHNKAYSECWARILERYKWGIFENMTPKHSVKLIGEKGVSFEAIGRSDAAVKFDISVVSSMAEEKASVLRLQKRSSAITAIMANPVLASQISPKWAVENILRDAEIPDEEVSVAMDVLNEGMREINAEAAEENQRMVAGKKVKPNPGATASHLVKHMDFITDESENLKPDVIKAIRLHFEAEVPIATKNEVRRQMSILKANQAIAGQGGGAPAQPALATPQGESPMAPVPPSVEGTARRSQQISESIIQNQ